MSEPWFDPVEPVQNPLWTLPWLLLLLVAGLAVWLVWVAWRLAYGCAALLAEAWYWWDRACDQIFISERGDSE